MEKKAAIRPQPQPPAEPQRDSRADFTREEEGGKKRGQRDKSGAYLGKPCSLIYVILSIGLS